MVAARDGGGVAASFELGADVDETRGAWNVAGGGSGATEGGHHESGEEVGADAVDLPRSLETVGGALPRVEHRAGVVDEDVDLSARALETLGEGADGGELGEVEQATLHVAVTGVVDDFSSSHRRAISVAARQDDAGARARELPRNLLADAGVRARHDAKLATPASGGDGGHRAVHAPAPRRVCALPEVIVNTKEVFGPRRHFRRGLE